MTSRRQLTSQLWYTDTAGRMDSAALADDNTAKAGFKSRRNVVEKMGLLNVDMLLQDRFLHNGVDVKIRLVRSKGAFELTAGGVNPTYTVNIVDVRVFARKATLNTAYKWLLSRHSTKAEPNIHFALLTAKCTRYRRVPCHTRMKTSSWAHFPNVSCCAVSTTTFSTVRMLKTRSPQRTTT